MSGQPTQPPRNETAASAASETATDEVDQTLIDWMLSLSPAERIEWNRSVTELILELRRGGAGA